MIDFLYIHAYIVSLINSLDVHFYGYSLSCITGCHPSKILPLSLVIKPAKFIPKQMQGSKKVSFLDHLESEVKISSKNKIVGTSQIIFQKIMLPY